MILLCGKIGEGGMEKKRINNRAAPGVSGPLFSTAEFLAKLVEGQMGRLRVSCSQKVSNPLQFMLYTGILRMA